MPSGCAIAPKTLERWLDIYLKFNGPHLDDYLGYYKKSSLTLDTAITEAVLGIGKVMHPHQYHVGESRLCQVADNLLDRRPKIDLRKNWTFADLHAFIKRHATKGFGKLAVYDTALRLSSYLGCLPNDVYLHAGTRRGWRSIVGKPVVDIVKWKDVPDPLKRLTYGYHVENFLCIFKNGMPKDCEPPGICPPSGDAISIK